MSEVFHQYKDFIEGWDEYWYEGAYWASRKSIDRACPVGALIVKDRVMIASGYNGPARGMFDDPLLLGNKPEKLRWICHAEVNAIFNAARQGLRVAGSTLYVTRFPCFACCNAMLQVGIVRVYTKDDWYMNGDPVDGDHARKRSLLRQSRIEVAAPFHPDYAAKPLPVARDRHG